MHCKNSLKPEGFLKVIDYVNHHYGGHSQVAGRSMCFECGTDIPCGSFRYDRRSLVPSSEIIQLNKDHIEFPLEHLHIGGHDDIEKYAEYKEGEKEAIGRLIEISQNWQIYTVPKNLIDVYIDVMKTSGLITIASVARNHWFNAVHSTPEYSEDEMKREPWKRKIMEDEKRICSKPDEIVQSIKPQIERLTEGIIGNRKLPNIYKSKEGTLEFQLYFIENTYDTLKAKNIFYPRGSVKSAINEIEPALKKGIEALRNSPF
ncbi:MAG: hypothetical protein JW716_03215 [Candidatus Aenigmarchaeota archaeon]|nr:hypothetical protein [Candidatus Aenigmarchaeota archaeon]